MLFIIFVKSLLSTNCNLANTIFVFYDSFLVQWVIRHDEFCFSNNGVIIWLSYLVAVPTPYYSSN